VFLSLTGRRADDEPGADPQREPMAA